MKYKCYKCKINKESCEFHKNKTKPNGLSNICKECVASYNKVRYHTVIKNNPEKLAKLRDYTANWHKLNPEAKLKNRIKNRYNLNLSDYNRLLEIQKNKCKICDFEFTDKNRERPHVDHDHRTGDIRGLLCINCNTGLGQFKDDPDILLKAINYIKIS